MNAELIHAMIILHEKAKDITLDAFDARYNRLFGILNIIINCIVDFQSSYT